MCAAIWVGTPCYRTSILRVSICLVNDEFTKDQLKWAPHQHSTSLYRRTYSRSSPAMSDHPRTRPNLYSAAAAPRVGHHTFLHHHGHHLPHSHLWTTGGFTLA